VRPKEVSENGHIFGLLRQDFDEVGRNVSIIRLLNFHLSETSQNDSQMFGFWHTIVLSSINYLLDLSQFESGRLRSLPTDLACCDCVSDMISLIFKLYSINSSLYRNVNHFLRCFPIEIVSKFEKELRGTLHFIYLLQSSIEYRSWNEPLSETVIVYRGMSSNGSKLFGLYESMIGEVIVWRSFTSTSRDRELVIRRFIQKDDEGDCSDGLLFEIELHPGDVAADIARDSDYPHESEILIAACSGFRVVAVDYITISDRRSGRLKQIEIPRVKLSYFLSWHTFDIDHRPRTVIL
jgi:hypothetical protein